MKTTIDSAGRIVIPRAIREMAQLRAGVPVEIRFHEGVIEIEPVPLHVQLQQRGELVVAVPSQPVEFLKQEDVDLALRNIRENRLDEEV